MRELPIPSDRMVLDMDQNKMDRQRVFTQFGTQEATATGTAADNATDVASSLVVVSTATATGQGLALPHANSGSFIAIRNSAANPVNVYPKGSDTIDGGTAAFVLGTATSNLFFVPLAGAWFTK